MEQVLDRLFRVTKIVEMPGGIKVQIRVLSDVERRECDLNALQSSALLVQRLRDPKSRDYQAIILPVVLAGTDAMRETLINYKASNIARQLSREIVPQYIPFPTGKGVGEDERREVIERRLKQEVEIAAKREEALTAQIDAYRKEVAAMSEDDVRSGFDRNAAQAFADTHYWDEYVRQTVQYCTHIEDGTRHYFSAEDIPGVPSPVIKKLWSEYNKLDISDPFLSQSESVTESSTE